MWSKKKDCICRRHMRLDDKWSALHLIYLSFQNTDLPISPTPFNLIKWDAVKGHLSISIKQRSQPKAVLNKFIAALLWNDEKDHRKNRLNLIVSACLQKPRGFQVHHFTTPIIRKAVCFTNHPSEIYRFTRYLASKQAPHFL